MKRSIIPLLLICAFATSASIRDSSLNIVNLYYTGSSSSDPGYYYLDGVPTKGNPNVGIEICDEGQVYVGAAYAINVGGSWKYALITYKSSSEALAQATDTGSASGCYFTPVDFLTFSPYKYTAPSPYVYVAAFPGKLYVTWGTSSNPGVLSNFIYVGNNGYLRGSYTVARSFDQSSCTITIQEPTITFQYYGGSFSAPASNSNVGISDERRMVIGVCIDDHGESCFDGDVFSFPSFPATFSTGLTGTPCVNDQITPIDRYVVINGLGNYICIGPNLKVEISSLTPNPVYYNMTLTVEYRIRNPRNTPYEIEGGNVDVTTDFYVRIKIYNATNSSQVVYENTFLITDDVPVDGIVEKTFTWKPLVHSGFYRIRIEVDTANDIGECKETDNYVEREFEVKPIVLPEIYINGLKTDHFPYAGRPYNLSIYLKNSDNDTLRNAEVYLYERNGLITFVPIQVWNRTVNETGEKEITITNSTVEVRAFADYYGWLNITVIPSGNKMLSPYYSYEGKDLLDYSIYFSGRYPKGGGWEDFKFVRNDQLYSYYPLHVDNLYTYESYGSKKTFFNQDSYVKDVIDWLYNILGNFWYAILGVG